MTQNLRNCPWCGAPAQLDSDFETTWWVQCTNLKDCGCSDGREYESPAEASRMWNRTPGDKVSAHSLFKTEDKDVPDSIKDRNGEVVLSQCRHCGRGEVELDEPCNPLFQED